MYKILWIYFIYTMYKYKFYCLLNSYTMYKSE